MKSICVYCGSNFNGDPILRTAIEGLAQALTDQNITLVYGGGSVGVMGVIADEVLKRNGNVTGVIPQFLLDKEVGHQSLTQMIVTENMHERKQTMADLSEVLSSCLVVLVRWKNFLKYLPGYSLAFTAKL